MTQHTTVVTTNTTFAAPSNLISTVIQATAYGGGATWPFGGVGGGFVSTPIPVSMLPLTIVIGVSGGAGGAGSAGYSGGGASSAAFGGGGSTAILTGGTTLLVEAGGADGGYVYNAANGNLQPGGSGGGQSSNTPANGIGFNGAASGGANGGTGGTGSGGSPAGGAGHGGGTSGNAASGTTSGAGVGSSTLLVANCGGCFVASSLGNSYSYGQGPGAPLSQATFTYNTADAPSTPTDNFPFSGEYLDTNALGVTFDGTYNAPSADTGTLAQVCLKVTSAAINGGTASYWNGTAFVTNGGVDLYIVPTTGLGAANGGDFTVVIPAGIIPDATTVAYVMSTKESLFGLASGFAASITFNTAIASSVALSSPLGVITTVLNTVSWSLLVGAGGPQFSYRYKIFAQSETNPGTTTDVPLHDTGTVNSAVTTITLPAVLSSGAVLQSNGATYYGYLLVTLTSGQQLGYVLGTFQLQLSAPTTPVLTAVAGTDPVTTMPAALLTAAMDDNLMPLADTSFEPYALGAYVGGWTIVNATPTVVNTAWTNKDLNQSLQLSSTGSTLVSLSRTGSLPGGGLVPCVPGQIMQVMATFQQPSLIQTATLSAQFFNAAGAFISQPTAGTGAGSVNGTAISGTVTAPAGAASCFPVLQYTSTGAAQISRFDKFGIFGKATAAWSPGVGVGLLQSQYQVSLDGGATWNDILADFVPAQTLATTGQTSTVYDTGSAFNVGLSYRVRNILTTLSQTYYSAWSNVVTIASPGNASTAWWLVDPANLPSAMQLHRLLTTDTSATPSALSPSIVIDEPERQGIFRPFGKSTATVVHGDMWAEEFDLDLYFKTPTEWANFKAIREKQRIVLLKSDMEGATYWVTLGPARPAGIMHKADRQINPARGLTIHCTPTDPFVPA